MKNRALSLKTKDSKRMIMRKRFAVFLIFLQVLCFAGCGSREDVVKVDLGKVEEAKRAVKELRTLRIGFVPERDIRNMAAKFEPLVEYLGRKLNIKVTSSYFANYDEVCDRIMHGRLDLAYFGSFSYVLTHAKAQVEPIVRPDYKEGSSYKGLIIVKKGGNIKNVADMKGKRLALVHPATYAGYLYPLYYLKKHGVNKPEEYFSEVKFAGFQDKPIFALLRGEADVAACKDLAYQGIIKENPNLEKELEILSVSAPVPSNAICVSRDLDPALKGKVKDILLNLSVDKEAQQVLESLGANGFIETKDKDYRNLYEMIEEMGIDLNIYPYYERSNTSFDRDNA